MGFLNPSGICNLDLLPRAIDCFEIPFQGSWPSSTENGGTWLDKNLSSI